MAEAGVPGYEATLWLSISGPAGMPKDIVQREAALEADATGDEELLRYMHAEDAKRGKASGRPAPR